MDEFIAIGDALFGWMGRPSVGMLWIVVILALTVGAWTVRRPIHPEEYAVVKAGKRAGNSMIKLAMLVMLALMVLLTLQNL